MESVQENLTHVVQMDAVPEWEGGWQLWGTTRKENQSCWWLFKWSELWQTCELCLYLLPGLLETSLLTSHAGFGFSRALDKMFAFYTLLFNCW